jgi:hypothetical protein
MPCRLGGRVRAWHWAIAMTKGKNYDSSEEWFNDEPEKSSDNNKFEYDPNKMGDDFCDAAAQEQDEQDEIEWEMARLQAEDEDDGEYKVVGELLFTLRARAKLSLHGLSVDDAVCIVTQGNHKIQSGSTTYYGTIGRRRGEVVVTSIVPKEYQNKGLSEVITGYFKN